MSVPRAAAFLGRRPVCRARRTRRLLPALAALAVLTCAAPQELTHTETGAPVGRGTLLVVNSGAASVGLLDALTGDRLIDLSVCDGPGDVAVSPGGATAVVSCRGAADDGHALAIIDVPTATVTATIELLTHGRPGGMAFLPDGRRLLVASGSTGQVVLVDVASRRLLRGVPTGHARAEQLVLDPSGARAFVTHGADGAVTVVDVERLVPVATLLAGQSAEGLAARPDAEEVWICDPADDVLAILTTESLAIVARLPCPGGPRRIAFTPDGRRAIVANARSGDVAVFAAGKRQLLATIPLALTQLEADDSRLFGRSLGADSAPDMTPFDVRPSRDGQQVWVSHPAANVVSVLDLAHLDVAGRLRAGSGPESLAWTPLMPGRF